MRQIFWVGFKIVVEVLRLRFTLLLHCKFPISLVHVSLLQQLRESYINYTKIHGNTQRNHKVHFYSYLLTKLNLLLDNFVTKLNTSNGQTCKKWKHHMYMSYISFQLMSLTSSQQFYLISSGDYARFVVYLWCGAVLKCNLDYHNCLLYCNIVEWHMTTLLLLRKCPFTNCRHSPTSVLEYIHHIIHYHRTVIIYVCPTCNIGFISLAGINCHHEILPGLNCVPSHWIAWHLIILSSPYIHACDNINQF